MQSKANIQRVVNNLLQQDISIIKNLQRGIINTRALASYLIINYHLDTSVDAVISAIRRFEKEESMDDPNIAPVFKDLIILTKNNIAAIKLKDDAFYQIAKDYMADQLLKKNMRLIKSKEYIKILITQKELEQKLNLFNKEDVLEITQNLCELRLILSKDFNKTKGVLARVSSELALHNVNIYDTILCVPEILFYVEEKELLEAQKSILELKEEYS